MATSVDANAGLAAGANDAADTDAEPAASAPITSPPPATAWVAAAWVAAARAAAPESRLNGRVRGVLVQGVELLDQILGVDGDDRAGDLTWSAGRPTRPGGRPHLVPR